ncbi:MAG: hypothetical protein R6W78_11080 [Bacteroidales bacterium]
MKTRIYPVLLLVFITATACFEDSFEEISDSVLINSSYSLPVGEVIYQINDYFEGLHTILIPLPDSVSYNDFIFPNLLDTIYKSDIIPFDFTIPGSDNERIKSITFRVIIENGFPTDVRVQVYFTAGLAHTNSLFPGGMESLQAASIDQNGIVTAPNVQIKDITLSPEILANLSNYTHIGIYGQIPTTRPDIEIVKFYTRYMLKFHFGMRVELEYNLNEL